MESNRAVPSTAEELVWLVGCLCAVVGSSQSIWCRRSRSGGGGRKEISYRMTEYGLNSKMQEALESAQLVIEQLKEQLDEENQEKFNTDMVTDWSSALDMVSKLLDATMATDEQRKVCMSTMEKIFRDSDTSPVAIPKPWDGSQMTLREKNHQIHTFWMNEIIRQRQLEQEKGEKEQKLQQLLNYRVAAMNSITKLKAKQFTRQQENQVEKRHLKMISDMQFAIDDFNRERKRISGE